MNRLIGSAILGSAIVLALLPAYCELTGPAGKRQVCSANLVALYQATRAYAADNDGYFPFAQAKQPPPHVWLWWFDYLQPYVKNPQIFCCPASKKADEYDVYAEPEPLLPGLAFSPYWVSYGMGSWYARDFDPRAPYRPDTLTDQHSTLLFADAMGQLVTSNKGGWNVDPRHEGAVNVVLADGTVVVTKPEYKPNGSYELLRIDNGRPLTWQLKAE
jgi:hypothetical protein